MCQSCRYIKKEDYYSSYCGNCFQEHELPNCVKCQHFRLKAGRCTNCGALGQDDIQWIDSCLDTDNNYMGLLNKTFEKRMADQKMNNKKFRTYNNCPLCKGYFHSAKACIFGKHALHFKEMEQQIKQLTLFANYDTKPAELLLPTLRINKDEDKDSGSETDFEESTMEDDQPVLLFDQILKIVQAMSSRKDAEAKQAAKESDTLDFT